MTFVKAILIMLGGAALGFFGCLGGIQTNSPALILGSLLLGAAVAGWGVRGFFRAFWRRFVRVVKPDENPKGPPPPEPGEPQV